VDRRVEIDVGGVPKPIQTENRFFYTAKSPMPEFPLSCYKKFNNKRFLTVQNIPLELK
jgi:hypothetical protein